MSVIERQHGLGNIATANRTKENTMAYVTAKHASNTSLMERVSDFIATQRQAYADHRLYVRTMNELKSLSNRELADLGLSRASLHDTAYQAVYG